MAAHPAIRKYIADYARSIGMDPQVALQVAGYEALNVFDPSKPDRGGDKGSSFGPFQLHYGGIAKGMSNPGLGDAFSKATGLDARDPSTWPQQVKFALDTAKQDGWRQWMGASDHGIPRWAGINQGQRGTGEPVEVDRTLYTGSIAKDQAKQYALPKAQSVGGAGVYQPPKQEISNTPANATTSPSSVTPPYGENQPPEVHEAQPTPYFLGDGKSDTKEPKNWLEVLGKGISDIGDATLPTAKRSGYQQPKAALVEGQPIAPVAPQDPNRRMMLAQIMAQLNSGRLF